MYKPKRTKKCSHKNLYVNVHSSIICNSQKVEAFQMCISWGMDKQNMVCIYLYSEILFSNTKKWSADTRYHMGEPWKHHVKRKKWSELKVAQSCPTLCDPMDCSPPSSSVHGDSPDKNTIHGNPGDLPNPGIEPRSPALQVDSLPTKPPVKGARHKGNALMIRFTWMSRPANW